VDKKKLDPFRKVTEEEKKETQKNREKISRDVAEVQELAIACLTDEKFVAFRKKYEKLERNTISALIKYVNPNPVEYAFNVRRMLDNLGQLKELLTGVRSAVRSKK